MNTKYPIILGSQSPRRQEIMLNAGFKFEIKNPDVNEQVPNNITISEIPVFLAIKKSRKLTNKNLSHIIICADTVVFKDNLTYNKPKNIEESKKMLRSLSNSWHKVTTGVSILGPGIEINFSDTTEVLFSEITEDEIGYYLANYKPFDKAGSYGIQEFLGMNKIKEIKGSFYNVMGLPIHKVYEKLRPFINYEP